MTTRKQIKRQHRLQREASQRALESRQTRSSVVRAAMIGAALVVALGGAVVFAVQPGSSGSDDEDVQSVALAMGDNYFQPEVLTLQAGQPYRVQLGNQGRAIHNVWMAGPDGQTGNGDDVRSKDLASGESDSVKVRFDDPGEYYFVCTFHAGMGGRIVVTQAPSTTAPDGAQTPAE